MSEFWQGIIAVAFMLFLCAVDSIVDQLFKLFGI